MSGVEGAAPDLDGLTDSELESLRLGAEVMSHKAGLEQRPLVAAFFAQLEQVTRAAARARTGGTPAGEAAELRLDARAEQDDRRLVAEYLGLLVANERLSTAVRQVCRDLRARHSQLGSRG